MLVGPTPEPVTAPPAVQLEEVEWDRSKNYRTYINAITPKSDLKNEIRGTVAEVIYDVYRNNSYELKDIGYVIKK